MGVIAGLIGLIPIRYWLITLAVIGGLGAAGYAIQSAKHRAEEEGAAAERAKIERANDASRSKANDAQQGADDCDRTGGNWDRATGLCDHAGSGPGR